MVFPFAQTALTAPTIPFDPSKNQNPNPSLTATFTKSTTGISGFILPIALIDRTYRGLVSGNRYETITSNKAGIAVDKTRRPTIETATA